MATPRKPKVEEGVHVLVNFTGSVRLIRDQVDWTPRGVRLLTKWYFDEGTEVEFAFDHGNERHCCSGMVVGCRPLREPRGFFETVLFFIETPCREHQKAACACRLAREGTMVRDETHFTATPAAALRDGAARDGARSRVRVD